MEPHDDVIRRLEADLERRRAKLNKKPTTYNKKRFNIVRDLLERWKKDKKLAEERLKNIDQAEKEQAEFFADPNKFL